MKALCLVVSDKKIFENCILKTYFLTPWPTYATNWNGLNNFDRGPPRDHSCEVWSKSNKRFQRRCCLKKLLTHARTDGRTTDAGHWRITKAHLSTSCSGELKKQSEWYQQSMRKTAGPRTLPAKIDKVRQRFPNCRPSCPATPFGCWNSEHSAQ